MEVRELPKETLLKSDTYKRHVDDCGICLRCHEWTSILDQCCGGRVIFEGGEVSADDLWDEIEEELKNETK